MSEEKKETKPTVIPSQDMQIIDPAILQNITAAGVIALALEKDLDVERLEKIIQLHQRLEERDAEIAYNTAMIAFKKNAPRIVKDKHVEFRKKDGTLVEYDHASIGNVVSAIIDGLAENDLIHEWIQEQTDNYIKITCRITHIQGYSKSTALYAKADLTGGKNDMQGIGSTDSYLKRYTLLAITGLATNEFDDDGRGYGNLKGKPNKKPNGNQNGNKNGNNGSSQAPLTFEESVKKWRNWFFEQTGVHGLYLKVLGDFGVQSATEIPAKDQDKFLKALKKEGDLIIKVNKEKAQKEKVN